jgi:spore cortex formation protein SpoVR/YcgB (stage V sporulation)
MYDDVRRAEAPEESLYAFLESSYEAGSRLAKWDRTSLEVWRDLNA